MEVSIRDLRKLRAKEWQLVVFSVMATVAPGTMIILLFHPNWFVEFQLGKLILLSLAITLPVVVINLLVVWPDAVVHSPIDLNAEKHEIDADYWYSEASMCAALCLYVSIAVSYWWGFSFRQFCFTAVALNVLLAIYYWVSPWWVARRG